MVNRGANRRVVQSLACGWRESDPHRLRSESWLQRQALQANPDKPLRVEDEETHKVYLVVGEEALPALWEDYIHREVAKGLVAIDRGEVEDWDIESVKPEGRQVLGEGHSQTS